MRASNLAFYLFVAMLCLGSQGVSSAQWQFSNAVQNPMIPPAGCSLVQNGAPPTLNLGGNATAESNSGSFVPDMPFTITANIIWAGPGNPNPAAPSISFQGYLEDQPFEGGASAWSSVSWNLPTPGSQSFGLTEPQNPEVVDVGPYGPVQVVPAPNMAKISGEVTASGATSRDRMPTLAVVSWLMTL